MLIYFFIYCFEKKFINTFYFLSIYLRNLPLTYPSAQKLVLCHVKISPANVSIAYIRIPSWKFNAQD